MSRTFSSMYKNNYSSDYVDILKMKCTKTCAINNYPIYDLSIYLTINDAALTYLTITDAALTYLTINDAALTYLTINDAALTYLTINDANTNYLSSRSGIALSLATSTYFNEGDIFIQGIRAGVGNFKSTEDASLNTCFGRIALSSTTSAAINCSAFGNAALAALTTGVGNSGFGDLALNQITIGARNTAVGSACLKFSINGNQNTAVGNGSGQTISSGNNNALLGYLAGGNVTTGAYNTLVGSSSNVGFGAVNSSTALGAYTSVGSYSFSTAIGGGSNSTPGATCTAAHQIMLGTLNETVVCPGTDASGSLIAAADIYINGIRAGVGKYQDVSSNTCFGNGALAATTTANNASAFGYEALAALTTGTGNSAFGEQSLQLLTTGVRNAAFGQQSLKLLTNGNYNAAFGQGAGQSLTTGSNNTFIGYIAGYNIGDASCNTCVGSNSGRTGGGTPSYSTLLGYNTSSMYSNSTAIGYDASANAAHQIMIGTPAEFVECPGTNATNGSLQLNGGVKLQTAYLAVPTSTMLGYKVVTSGSAVTLASDITSNLVSVSVPVGVWSVSFSVSCLATGGGNVTAQNIVFSTDPTSTTALSAICGQIKKHSSETYALGDVYIVSNCFTYQNTTVAGNIYLNMLSTFTGGAGQTATGYVSLTRIG